MEIVHLLAFNPHLDEIEKTLRAVNIVPSIIEVGHETRVLDLGVLKPQEKDLGRATKNEANDLNYNLPVFEILLRHNVAEVEVDREWNDKAKSVDDEQPLNE